jgi:hypothetical protein
MLLWQMKTSSGSDKWVIKNWARMSGNAAATMREFGKVCAKTQWLRSFEPMNQLSG